MDTIWRVRKLAFCATALLSAVAASAQIAPTPTDVPANHWARPAVLEVTGIGILTAPNGRFNGAAPITRTQLAIAMANFGRSLEKGLWRGKPASPVRAPKNADAALKSKVTRYEAAAVISRIGRVAATGMPQAGPKRFGQSEAIWPMPKITGVPKNHPAYSSLVYLRERRMLIPKSILVKPGNQPVTGKELADTVAMVVIGANDQLTDEPQNREEIPHRPSR